MKKTLTDSEQKVMDLIKMYGEGQTWWMSSFYGGFCKVYNLDFNATDKNTRKIRSVLNSLCKTGELKKSVRGTGLGGKFTFNSTKYTAWTIKPKP
jgi:hypothetical protein